MGETVQRTPAVPVAQFVVAGSRHHYHAPLHEAAWTGAIEAVKILVRAEADTENEFGETPPDLAARNGHTEAADYLSNLGNREFLCIVP